MFSLTPALRSYSRCIHLVDCPFRPLLTSWSSASSAPRFRFFCNVILTSRSLHNSWHTLEEQDVLQHNEHSPQRSAFRCTSQRTCMNSDHVSPRIRFNAAARLTNLWRSVHIPCIVFKHLNTFIRKFKLVKFVKVSCYWTFHPLSFILSWECAGGFSASMWSRAQWHHGLLLFRVTECAPPK